MSSLSLIFKKNGFDLTVTHLRDCIKPSYETLLFFSKNRIIDPIKGRLNKKPFPVEIEIEKDIFIGNLEDTALYDGSGLMVLYSELLEKIDHADSIKVIITNRYLATPDPSGKYHIRYGVYGDIGIISTKGIIYGPARPREYYTGKITQDIDFLREKDPRLPIALFWFVLMQQRFVVLGHPFCRTKGCVFFNPHWQIDLIKSQINGKPCRSCSLSLNLDVTI